MNENETYVYYCNISNLNIDLVNSLPLFRKEKALKYKSINDQRLCIGAYLLLKKAMSIHDIDINLYEYKETGNGKPYLKNCPYQFSISHSGKYVAVAISLNDVGIDIQLKKEYNEKIINRIFNENDINYYNKSNDKLDCFYKIWTYKEALVKQSGKGIDNDFKNINIDYNNIYNINIDNYKLAVTLKIKRIKEVEL